ncbi:YaaC family protein [Streptomyces sp. NBC_01643]|uniref:YaaC family protein n=1 Tax=Streptomyces sp. NBC_01643 TaxID=2975906 RepID=UPI00386D5AA5|nr:YaaC family protein [Streptomyces sp. NBC_01643]
MHSDLDADEAWERLRASRSNPPGKAADPGARRKTYAAALEQTGQMFRAAAVVDSATRPLQVFYGLSQAGRAIAAAALSLKGQHWRLESHGIKTTGFHLPFSDIEIRTDPPGTQGSFVRVSEALGSPVWGTDPIRLEDLWDLLPPNLRYPLTARDRMTPLYADEMSVGTHEHPLLSVPVCDIPDRVIDAGTREALAEFLTAYPAVAKHESYVTTRTLSLGSEAPPDYGGRYNYGGGELVVNWEMPQGSAPQDQRLEYLRSMTRGYGGARYFLPVLSPMKQELHPLMAWWAVLYALSMLARYQPAAWVKLISVDDSQHAVPIERLLERAISHLPVLIADTITEVST